MQGGRCEGVKRAWHSVLCPRLQGIGTNGPGVWSVSDRVMAL